MGTRGTSGSVIARIAAWLGVVVAAVAFAGCGSTDAYKKAVEADIANLPATGKFFYQQCIASTCGGLTPELVTEHIHMDAALACIVDIDHDRSTPTNKSLACVCSESENINDCRGWLGVQ